MKRRSLVINYLLVAVLTMSPVTLAQTPTQPNRDWAVVKNLPSGDLLMVKLKGEVTMSGTLISVSDTILRLYIQRHIAHSYYDDILDLNKDDILQIYYVKKKSVKKIALVGAVVGAGIGAAAGTAGGAGMGQRHCLPDNIHCVSSGSSPIPIIAITMAGAIVGSTIGLLIGIGKKRVLVYKV